MKEGAVETVGQILRKKREARGMSVAEVSRVTRIPLVTLQSIERDHFDDLPGEVFVRGFLRSFAQTVGLSAPDILARYTQSRRVTEVTQMPVTAPARAVREGSRRFGVAIACVFLLILFTLAVSIMLRPRGRDVPVELSQTTTSHTADVRVAG